MIEPNIDLQLEEEQRYAEYLEELASQGLKKNPFNDDYDCYGRTL